MVDQVEVIRYVLLCRCRSSVDAVVAQGIHKSEVRFELEFREECDELGHHVLALFKQLFRKLNTVGVCYLDLSDDAHRIVELKFLLYVRVAFAPEYTNEFLELTDCHGIADDFQDPLCVDQTVPSF